MLLCCPVELCHFTLPPPTNGQQSAHFLSNFIKFAVSVWCFKVSLLCAIPLHQCHLVFFLCGFLGRQGVLVLEIFELLFLYSFKDLYCCMVLFMFALSWYRLQFDKLDNSYPSFRTQLRSCLLCKASSDTPGWFRSLFSVFSSIIPLSKHLSHCTVCSAPLQMWAPWG